MSSGNRALNTPNASGQFFVPVLVDVALWEWGACFLSWIPAVVYFVEWADFFENRDFWKKVCSGAPWFVETVHGVGFGRFEVDRWASSPIYFSEWDWQKLRQRCPWNLEFEYLEGIGARDFDRGYLARLSQVLTCFFCVFWFFVNLRIFISKLILGDFRVVGWVKFNFYFILVRRAS